MTQTRVITAVALLGLAACHAETIDPNKQEKANANAAIAAANKMPRLPTIASSKIYRCDDNSVANIDFMVDGINASLRMGDEGVSKQLVASEKGKPFEAPDGYSLEGSGNTVKLAIPGHKSNVSANSPTSSGYVTA